MENLTLSFTHSELRVIVWLLFFVIRPKDLGNELPHGTIWDQLDLLCFFQEWDKPPLGDPYANNPKTRNVMFLHMAWKLWPWREMGWWHPFLIILSREPHHIHGLTSLTQPGEFLFCNFINVSAQDSGVLWDEAKFSQWSDRRIIFS